MAGVKGRSGGSNRRSLEDHKRRGTFRDDKHGSLSVAPANLVRLDMPFILDCTQTVTREEIFDVISGYLFKYGQTAQEDEILLTMIVDQIMIYRQADEIFRAEGVAGTIGRQLAKTVLTDAGKEIRVLLGEFGLTPNTRTRNSPIEGEVTEVASLESAFAAKVKQRQKGNE